jgi:hypothetical protein
MHFMNFSAVLDPRISYEGMKADYSNDPVLRDYLEESKTNLIAYYKENYAAEDASAPTPSQTITPSQQNVSGSPQKCFTSRYRNKSKVSINELEEYWKLPVEDFETCDPIQWWMGRWAQFPKLFELARYILCIPGGYSDSLYCLKN